MLSAFIAWTIYLTNYFDSEKFSIYATHTVQMHITNSVCLVALRVPMGQKTFFNLHMYQPTLALKARHLQKVALLPFAELG